MKQSPQQLNSQEQYRRSQQDTQARLVAAKQPINADSVALLTDRDIDQMPAEVYKVHLTTNPAFVARVNELEALKTRKPR